MSTLVADKGCLGTTLGGVPCARNKERCTAKYAAAEALLVDSSQYPAISSEARTVNLEFCHQHKRQADLLLALVKQQQQSDSRDPELPETGLNKGTLDDQDVRTQFLDIPNTVVFLQQDVESTMARLPSARSSNKKSLRATVENDSSSDVSSNDGAGALNISFHDDSESSLSPAQDLPAKNLATHVAIAKRQRERLTPGPDSKTAADAVLRQYPNLESNRKAKAKSPAVTTVRASRSPIKPSPVQHGTSKKTTPAKSGLLGLSRRDIRVIIEEAVDRGLKQPGLSQKKQQQDLAAMRKAQQEWETFAKIYKEDLDKCQQTLMEQTKVLREMMREIQTTREV